MSTAPTQPQPLKAHQEAAVNAARSHMQAASGLSPQVIEVIIQTILTLIQSFVPPSPAPQPAPPQQPKR